MKSRRTRIGAYAILVNAGQLLLCRLSRKVPTWKGHWTLPGGGIEFGETPEQAMTREVREETGLDVVTTGLAGIDSVTASFKRDEEVHSLRVIYFAEVVGGTLRPELAGSTDLCAWHELGTIADLKTVELVNTGVRLLETARPR